MKFVTITELKTKSRNGKGINIPGLSHGGAQPCNDLRYNTCFYITPYYNDVIVALQTKTIL